MPAPTDPAAYPGDFWEIAERVALHGETWRCEHQDARRLRSQWYGWGRALRRAELRPKPDRRVLDAARLFAQCTARLVDGVLMIQPRSSSWVALAAAAGEFLPPGGTEPGQIPAEGRDWESYWLEWQATPVAERNYLGFAQIARQFGRDIHGRPLATQSEE